MADLDSLDTRGRRAARAPGRVRQSDIAHMIARHGLVRKLCDALESCADHLPSNQAIDHAATVSAALALQLHHAEARNLAMVKNLARDSAPERLLDRVRRYQALDQLQAEDLHDALVVVQAHPGRIPMDTLGYMMRCLFDGCRRAVDLQEAALLLLAPGRMTVAARAALGASLSAPWRAAARPGDPE